MRRKKNQEWNKPTRKGRELRDWRAVLDDLLLCGSQKVRGRMWLRVRYKRLKSLNL